MAEPKPLPPGVPDINNPHEMAQSWIGLLQQKGEIFHALLRLVYAVKAVRSLADEDGKRRTGDRLSLAQAHAEHVIDKYTRAATKTIQETS